MIKDRIPGFIKLLSLSAILCLATFLITEAVADDKALEIEAEAKTIEKRAYEALTSSYPGAKFQAFIVYEMSESGNKTEIEYSAYYDSARLRLKKRYRHIAAGAGEVTDSATDDAKGWSQPDYVIIKDEDVIIRNSAFERGTYKTKQSTMGDLYANTKVFWPQFIGTSLVPVWRMPQASPRGFLSREDHVATKITEEDYNQLKTIRVDYTLKSQGDLSVWYCPAQNGLIVKMYGHAKTNTRLLETHIEITNQQWSPGIWFPKHIKYLRGSKGHDIERETTEIQSFEVIEPEDEEFDFKGVELPIGAPVQDITAAPSEQLLIWTKEGLRLMTDEEIRIGFPIPKKNLPKGLTKIDEKSDTEYGYEVLVIFNLVIIAIFAAWFFWRKRA